jgi:hypothetical protein
MFSVIGVFFRLLKLIIALAISLGFAYCSVQFPALAAWFVLASIAGGVTALVFLFWFLCEITPEHMLSDPKPTKW